MIFNIIKHPYNTFVIVIKPCNDYDTWDLYNMLAECFPNISMSVACYGGYDAIELHPNYSGE